MTVLERPLTSSEPVAPTVPTGFAWSDLSSIVLAYDGDIALGASAAEPELDDDELLIRLMAL